MDVGGRVPKAPTRGVERKSAVVDKVAEMTGYDRATVYAWIRKREVETFQSHHSRRIYLDSLRPKHWKRVREKIDKEEGIVG